MKATNGAELGMSKAQMALMLIVMTTLSLGMLWLMASASMQPGL